MKKVIGYIRVSTQEQASNGFGLDAQKQRVIDYARKNKLGNVVFYEERGVSGAVEDRPVLAELRTAIEAGEIGTVIIVRLDRLARDLILQETILGDWEKLGANVLSIDEPDLLSNDPSRKLLRQMKGAFNEYEKAMIKLRLLGGRLSKARQGGFTGGQRPLGYAKTIGFNGRAKPDLIKDPQEVETVELIFRLKRKRISLHQIAEELNRRGVATKRGGKWYAGTVRYILKNPVYKGLMSFKGIGKKREELAIV